MAHAEVARECTRELACLGNSINQIHGGQISARKAIDAVEVIGRLIANEPALAALIPLGPTEAAARQVPRRRDTAEFFLGERDADGKLRESVKVPRRDPHQVAAVADSLPIEDKHMSGVIAWAPVDGPTEEQIGVVLDAFEGR